MKKEKLVMIIAGSQWQIPIVKKVNELGYKSLVVNLYYNSPAFKYADFAEVCDILDKDLCLNIAKNYKIDAVLSEECDIAMPTVAYIADSLGLPSLGLKNAALYTNKFLMREFCIKHNLSSPRYKKCNCIEEAQCFYNNSSHKLIIKPLDANSSRGVKIITQLEDLSLHWSDTLTFSKIEKSVLIEEYIDGPEFTVDGIMTPNGHRSLAISKKKHFSYNPNIASELFFKNQSDTYDYDALRRQNDMFVDLSHLRYGTLTHAEYKYNNGRFYLIEIAARGGGNMISSHIVPLMSGLDNYKYYIQSVVSNALPELTMKDIAEDVCAVLKFFDVEKNGTVSDIKGLKFLQNNPNVIFHQFNFSIGDVITKASNDSQRAGFYIAKSESEETLKRLIETIENKVKIVVK